MSIAVVLPGNRQSRRKTIYEHHLDDLLKLLDQRPGLAGWEIWLHFAAKHELSRRDVTELLDRAISDHWIVGRSGDYFPILRYGDDD
jgi:hypothetical protein